MEAEVIDAVAPRDAEDAAPGGSVGGRVACEREDGGVVLAAEEGDDVVNGELRAAAVEEPESERRDYAVNSTIAIVDGDLELIIRRVEFAPADGALAQRIAHDERGVGRGECDGEGVCDGMLTFATGT